jgi:hypothetical protein
MEVLLKYKEITEKEDIEIIKKFTNIKTVIFGEYTQYTYSVAITKNGKTKFEDYIYKTHPLLIKILSRGFSIILKKNEIISILEGPTKFSGKTLIDEDDEEEKDEKVIDDDDVYKHDKIIKWSKKKILEIIETEKANGKFVILRIQKIDNKLYLHVGSKNKHLFFAIEEIDEWIVKPEIGDIIKLVLEDIKKNIDYLTDKRLLEKFSQNYSLCGELCDGQHFMEGDNTINWFGLFIKGKSMETQECFEFMKSIGIKTVSWSIIYDKNSELVELDKVFLLSRCKMNEGSVLRCRNINTNEIILVKTKSVSYITKRFMRQAILGGYAYMVETVKKRFIEAQKYHGLNTNASIKMCNQLIKFGFWLMNKEYPSAVLDVKQVNSIRGCLINGFYHYWSQYLLETGEKEQNFTLEDFGEFDNIEFTKKTEPYKLRNYSEPVCVLFFQGIQGSGKSTLGQNIIDEINKLNDLNKKAIVVEQDRFYGCSLSCQGFLHHNIKNGDGPNIILVTRCNVNEKQYEKYLQLCHKLPSLVTFITPKNIDELYLAICLEGVLHRSANGDNLLVGRKEYPIEEASKFIIDNFKDLKKQKISNEINIFKDDIELKKEVKKIYLEYSKSKNSKSFIDWVKINKEKLHNLRNTIKYLTTQIIDIIDKTFRGINIIYPNNFTYIGLAVKDKDKNNLIEIIKKNNNIIDYSKSTFYVHHCTQIFFGNNKNNNSDIYCKPLDSVDAIIDALVIRKKDGACCFRIKKSSLICNKNNIKIEHVPHITGILPFAEKPVISNQIVALTDETVEIIPLNYELVLTGFYA